MVIFTLVFLVSFGQLPFEVRHFDLRVGSGGARRVVMLCEVRRAFVRELGMELDLVDHLEDRLCEQLRARCRLG